MARSSSPLGKGLMALLPIESENGDPSQGWAEKTAGESPYFLCPIAFIQPNPYQPRKSFNPEELESLAASIREKGILQPLVVRKVEDNNFELIAGERRLRAAQLAELEKVPVIVKDIAISDRLELALIENIQRENLNPLEEAEAYAQLIEEFSLTQETVSKRVGKNRSTVANALRILQLPAYAKISLSSGSITSGHARVLLSLTDEDQIRSLHDAIIANSLSVRETEALAKKMKSPGKNKPAAIPPVPILPAAYCQTLTKTLSDYFGSKSTIVQKGAKGKIEVEFTSAEDLERLLALIIQEKP
jgi:ParB family chromosome partitioning protein